ncbi:MAG: 16S rRNA (cytidine(1402)-2'-O)-methyltransferase [Acidobacteriota bacterium]
MPLYVVPTPIGHMEDITYRAVRVLREADIIACEDTRRTRQLLHHYGISTPLLSYHEHNERRRTHELLERLRVGATVALVSDAGTPLISDPGGQLLRAAIDAGLPVSALPGACAATTALSAAGLSAEGFHFVGFLPPKPSARREALKTLTNELVTLVFYEAPHRLLAFLQDALTILGNRSAVVARELTKLHETYVRGFLDSLVEHFRTEAPRGEIVVLIDGKKPAPLSPLEDTALLAEIERGVAEHGLSPVEAVKQAAQRHRLPRRQVYQQWLRHRAGVPRGV